MFSIYYLGTVCFLSDAYRLATLYLYVIAEAEKGDSPQ